MAGPLKIAVGVEERAAVSGIKKIGASLEDVQEEFGDLAKDGDKSLGKLEKSYESLAKEAERTERKIGGGDGFKKAGAASSEFKSEALQNFSEVTSSFDGSMQSVGDLAQGTLGGIASSIPGIGLLGGAAAVGIGLITTELVAQAEQAAFLKERLGSAYQEAAEEGRNYISTAQAVAEANDLFFNPERAAEYARIKADAKTLMLDEGILIDANAGKIDAQRVVQERIAALVQESKDEYTATDSIVGNLGQSVLGLQNRWQDVADETQAAKDKAAELDAYTTGAGERERAQIQRTRDAAQARYEALARQAATPINIRLGVDDSAVRNYRPPIIQVQARIQMPAGSRQLIQ